MNDRHGRLHHVDHDRRRRPSTGYRLGSDRRFAQMVQRAVAAADPVTRRLVAPARLVVAAVPGPGDDADALATFAPEVGDRPAVLTVYRRAAEQRADDRDELLDLLRGAIIAAVGQG